MTTPLLFKYTFLISHILDLLACMYLQLSIVKNDFSLILQANCQPANMQPSATIANLTPRPHPQKEKKVWYTSNAFLRAQDAGRHVTVMTTHHFGIATHQPPSRAAITDYSAVSHDNHM